MPPPPAAPYPYYQRYGVLALARVAGLVRLLQQQQFLAGGSFDVYADLAECLHGKRRAAPAGEVTTESFDAVLGAAYRAWGRWFFNRAFC